MGGAGDVAADFIYLQGRAAKTRRGRREADSWGGNPCWLQELVSGGILGKEGLSCDQQCMDRQTSSGVQSSVCALQRSRESKEGECEQMASISASLDQ